MSWLYEFGSGLPRLTLGPVLLGGSLLISACDPNAITTKYPASNVKLDRVETFSQQDQKGRTFDLEEALKRGPVALIFYRGHW